MKIAAKSTKTKPLQGRPLAMGDQGTRKDSKPCFFPDSIDRIPLCSADRLLKTITDQAQSGLKCIFWFLVFRRTVTLNIEVL